MSKLDEQPPSRGSFNEAGRAALMKRFADDPDKRRKALGADAKARKLHQRNKAHLQARLEAIEKRYGQPRPGPRPGSYARHSGNPKADAQKHVNQLYRARAKRIQRAYQNELLKIQYGRSETLQRSFAKVSDRRRQQRRQDQRRGHDRGVSGKFRGRR